RLPYTTLFRSAVSVLLEAAAAREDAEGVNLAQVWERIERLVPRGELAAALRALEELLPAPDSDEDEAWRAELVNRYASVRGFLPMLCEVIDFDATVEGAAVLEAMRALPELIGRKKIRAREVDTQTYAPPATASPEDPRPRGRHRTDHRVLVPSRLSRGPGRGAQGRLRLLRPGAVPPPPQAPRHLRSGLQPLGRPALEAALGGGVGAGQAPGPGRPGAPGVPG